MTLSIAAIPRSHWRNLIPLLEALGWQKDQQAPESWYLTAPAKSASNAGNCVLLHERPEYAVASSIAAGQSPDDAIQQWSASVDALFTLCRALGQSAIMLDIHSVPGNEHALFSWLTEHRSDWQPAAVIANTELRSLNLPKSDALPLLLAREVVRTSENLVPKIRRLEAMSIPLAEDGYKAPEIESAVLLSAFEEQTRELSDGDAAAKEQLDQSNQKLDLLELQLAQVQDELEQSDRHKVQLEKQLKEAVAAKESAGTQKHAELDEELQRLQDKLAVTETTLGRELKDTKAENELLVLQLHQVQEELESLSLREETQKNELSAAQQEIKSLKKQAEAQGQAVDRLKVSEGQLQSDLKRRETELEENVSELESTKAELSLVKGHLKNTQEDLKVQHHRNEQLDQQLQQKQNEITGLYGRITEKNRKLQKLSQSKKLAIAERDEQQKLKQAAEHRNNLLERELDKLHHSVSWRLASPVRMMSGVATAIHKPSRQQKTIKQQAALIAESELFDEAWYLHRYPDVLNTDLKPAEHYLKHGAAEGRDPSEHFSTRWYLKKYSDVAEAGINPVLHYILYGKEEGRKPLPTKKR